MDPGHLPASIHRSPRQPERPPLGVGKLPMRAGGPGGGSSASPMRPHWATLSPHGPRFSFHQLLEFLPSLHLQPQPGSHETSQLCGSWLCDLEQVRPLSGPVSPAGCSPRNLQFSASLCPPPSPNTSFCNRGTKPLQGAPGPPTHPHPHTQLLGRRQETFWQDQSPARGPDPCAGL